MSRFDKPYEDRLKESRRKEQSKKKNTLDHRWPLKRSKNLETMIKKMQKDPALLFETAAELLRSYSDFPWKLGDENMSILIAWVAAQMTNFSLEYQRKKGKKKRA